jgi:hypothetical protein
MKAAANRNAANQALIDLQVAEAGACAPYGDKASRRLWARLMKQATATGLD